MEKETIHKKNLIDRLPKRGKVLWSDEFDTDGLPDNDEWSFDVGISPSSRDLQIYTDTNAYVQDDCLVIETRKEQEPNELNPQLRYTSSRLVSKRTFKYGIFEARIRVTRSRFVWPAFWLRSFDDNNFYYDDDLFLNKNNYKNINECSNYLKASIYCNLINSNDIMISNMDENNKYNERIYEICKCRFCSTQSFHIYTIDWNKDRIKFYVDQHEYFSYRRQESNLYGETSWPFDSDMNIVFNTFVRGKWPLNKVYDERPFPSYAFIDYVRYYESL